eukprot:GHVS01076100.1.p1 GENE.GHVS01076100.1~~GHVS01076100.1.p1  ORF type:complete len:320 (-),score=57.28 GHVS01076100.1:534-1493(-)
MFRQSLSIFAIVALSCSASVQQANVAEASLLGFSLQTPEVFQADNLNFLLPGYPPLSHFYFHVVDPANKILIDKFIQECMRHIVGQPMYTVTAEMVQKHYHCDVTSFWDEFHRAAGDLQSSLSATTSASEEATATASSEDATATSSKEEGGEMRRRLFHATTDSLQEANQQPSVATTAVEGKADMVVASPVTTSGCQQFIPAALLPDVERNGRVKACQQAELTHACLFIDDVVACVRTKVPEMIQRLPKQVETSDDLAQIDKWFVTGKINAACNEWAREFCSYLTQRGHCLKRLEEVPSLGQEITKKKSAGILQYQGCF